MRVQFNIFNGVGVTVIEAVQMIRLNNKRIGLVVPYTKRFEKINFDTYESNEPVDEADFNRWCEQLCRTGYLDLTRTDFVFKGTHQ